MQPPTLLEADAFLSMTLYADGWNTNTDIKRQQAINSAQALLRGVYPETAILNDYVYYQAAHMLTGAYRTSANRISSQSVSTGGVSQSFATGMKLEKRDLLAPEVLFGLGEPPKHVGPVEIGVIG